MMWDITEERGFLGMHDPLRSLSLNSHLPGTEKYIPLIARLENIPICLANWIEERRVREELVVNLREISGLFDEDFFSLLDHQVPADEANYERLMHLYSYMASAYVYARHETPATRIPCEIAIPLVKVADHLGRKPILSYASYCLTNWERNISGPLSISPICLDNISLMTNFCTPEVGKRDEDWFILIHVEIEAGAAPGVYACKQLLDGTSTPYLILSKIHQSLISMNKTLERMPEQCSPDNYFRWVRPYIFSFNNVVYEGCFDNQPQTFRGETGAQSTIIPLFLTALGIKHKNSMLTHHLMEMRDYMPQPHQKFLQNLVNHQANSNVSLRTCAITNNDLRAVYNECITEIVRFRAKHFEYAMNYIYNKVDNPNGTGGTPYVPWLKQLKEETEEHFI